MAHLVQDHTLERPVVLHRLHVVAVELHHARVADAGVVLPDSRGTSGSQDSPGAVDALQNGCDHEHACLLVRGSAAGRVRDDRLPSVKIGNEKLALLVFGK